MKTKRYNFGLMLPTNCAKRLQFEVDFLGIQSKVLQIDEATEIRSRVGLIDWAVGLFIQASEDGWAVPGHWHHPSDCECDRVSLSLNAQSKGTWDYAVKMHFAQDFHALGYHALLKYFLDRDNQAKQDLATHHALSAANPNFVIESIRRGEFRV